MDHLVKLDRLPQDFAIPGDLSERFRYDADGRRLAFRGFMSKGEFDRLYLLSQDWSYRRALDDLFRACTVEDDAPRRGLGGRVKGMLASLGLL